MSGHVANSTTQAPRRVQVDEFEMSDGEEQPSGGGLNITRMMGLDREDDHDDWDDFTNASPWEELQQDVEQALLAWGLQDVGVVRHASQSDADTDNPTNGKGYSSPWKVNTGVLEGINGGKLHWKSVDICASERGNARLRGLSSDRFHEAGRNSETNGSTSGTPGRTLLDAVKRSTNGNRSYNPAGNASTYRLTLYYGNPKAGLPKWASDQKHLTPTMLSLLDFRQDFRLGEPFIFRCFGLSHFLLFRDVHNDACPPNQLLSIVSVALSNINCTLPVFVPLQETTRRYYAGIATPGNQGGSTTIHFETDQTKPIPSSLCRLEGLTRLLKGKISMVSSGEERARSHSSGSMSMKNGADQRHITKLSLEHAVRLIWTARTSSITKDTEAAKDNSKFSFLWRKSRHHGGILLKDLGIETKSRIPSPRRDKMEKRFAAAKVYKKCVPPTWGPISDPLQQIWVFALWPRFPDGAFIENDNYTSLRATQAPEWWVRCSGNNSVENWRGKDGEGPISKDDTPLAHSVLLLARLTHDCPADRSSNYIILASRQSESQSSQRNSDTYSDTATIDPWVGVKATARRGAARFFQRLHHHASPIKQSNLHKESLSLMPEYFDVCTSLRAIFGEENIEYKIGLNQDLADKSNCTSEGDYSSATSLTTQQDFGSLTSILGLHMCEYADVAGMSGVSCLWGCFVEELAWYWDNNVLIPRVRIKIPTRLVAQRLSLWMEKTESPDLNSIEYSIAILNALIRQIQSFEASADVGSRSEESAPTVNAMDESMCPSPNQMKSELILCGISPRKLEGLHESELKSIWEQRRIGSTVSVPSPATSMDRSVGNSILDLLRKMPMKRVLAEQIGPALRASSIALRFADSDAAANIAIDPDSIPSLSTQLQAMDRCISKFEEKNGVELMSTRQDNELALILNDACDEIARTELMLSFATSLSRKLDNDCRLLESLLSAEFPADSAGNVDSQTTRADGSVLVIGEKSRNAVRGALAMMRHGGSLPQKYSAGDDNSHGEDVASDDEYDSSEVEYPDEDEQGLPDPDVKEYIIRCTAHHSRGGESTTRYGNSTVHRLYAMVEPRNNHIRLACAISEREALYI